MVNCLPTLAVKSKSTDVLTMSLSIIAAFAYGINDDFGDVGLGGELRVGI
jgi:hypothetical protein